jgi:hypothetical protein
VRWDVREPFLPAPNYNTPVKDLTYKDLLTKTFLGSAGRNPDVDGERQPDFAFRSACIGKTEPVVVGGCADTPVDLVPGGTMMPMESAHGPMSLYYIDYYIGVKCHL